MSFSFLLRVIAAAILMPASAYAQDHGAPKSSSDNHCKQTPGVTAHLVRLNWFLRRGEFEIDNRGDVTVSVDGETTGFVFIPNQFETELQFARRDGHWENAIDRLPGDWTVPKSEKFDVAPGQRKTLTVDVRTNNIDLNKLATPPKFRVLIRGTTPEKCFVSEPFSLPWFSG